MRARLVAAIALAVVLLGAPTGARVVPLEALQTPASVLVDRFLAPERTPLVSYRAYRTLTASTRGGKTRGSLDALTWLDPKTGFDFEVTSAQGSETIRNRVLLPALEAEQKAFNGPGAQQAALTPANYEFLDIDVDANADNLLRVNIRPRRKHAMLLNGTMFLSGDTADLVRVEGEPVERPSFWTRHVKIVREYERVDGVRVPVAMRSTADVLIIGSSMFSMTYRYIEINGVRVD